MGSARRPYGPRYAAPALRSLWRIRDTGTSRTEIVLREAFNRQGPKYRSEGREPRGKSGPGTRAYSSSLVVQGAGRARIG
jgi:hypothetical protein